MKRILCVISSMNTGGAETFLMKLYRSLNKDEYQMDFCVSDDNRGYYYDEIESLGGKILRMPKKGKNPLKALMVLKKIVKENDYKYVFRIAQSSIAAIDLLFAKFGGAKVLILRSSNTNTCGGLKSRIIHRLFSFLPKWVPNVKFAPSTEAAEHVFGGGCVKKGKVKLLHNAINVDEYVFDENIRNQKRQEFGVSDDTFVVGHVGRLSRQKNHRFLLEVFSEIKKRISNSVLILIGEGELQSEIEQYAQSLGIADGVRFLGVRSDVPKLYMAMDVCVFPSFFEGMPNVIIEAQASGLKCLVSDSVTKEADITGLVKYISLEESAVVWANEAVLYNDNYKRCNMKQTFIDNKYDMNQIGDYFINIITK